MPIPSGRRCGCTATRAADCYPQFLVRPTDLTAARGQTVTFSCSVASATSSGIPLVRVSWLKNRRSIKTITGKQLDNGDFPLVIPRASIVDVGHYECRVTNQYGLVKARASLTVHLGKICRTEACCTTYTNSESLL